MNLSDEPAEPVSEAMYEPEGPMQTSLGAGGGLLNAFLKYAKTSYQPGASKGTKPVKVMDLSGFLQVGTELKFTAILSTAFVQKIFQVVRSNRHPSGLTQTQRSSDRSSISVDEFAVCINIAYSGCKQSLDLGGEQATGAIVLQRCHQLPPCVASNLRPVTASLAGWRRTTIPPTKQGSW